MITELVDVLFEEPICQAEESENSDLDEKTMGDKLEESNTSSPLEVFQTLPSLLISLLKTVL